MSSVSPELPRASPRLHYLCKPKASPGSWQELIAKGFVAVLAAILSALQNSGKCHTPRIEIQGTTRMDSPTASILTVVGNFMMPETSHFIWGSNDCSRWKGVALDTQKI